MNFTILLQGTPELWNTETGLLYTKKVFRNIAMYSNGKTISYYGLNGYLTKEQLGSIAYFRKNATLIRKESFIPRALISNRHHSERPVVSSDGKQKTVNRRTQSITIGKTVIDISLREYAFVVETLISYDVVFGQESVKGIDRECPNNCQCASLSICKCRCKGRNHGHLLEKEFQEHYRVGQDLKALRILGKQLQKILA